MKLTIAKTLFVSGLIAPISAFASEKPEPTIVGHIEVTDEKASDDVGKALVAGLCRYNGGRVICPYKENEVALTINRKIAQ